MITEHRRACSLCEAICGLVIETEGGHVRAIRGDPDDPLSRGHICPKAVALQDLHEDPDRLRRPLVKKGGVHVEVPWDEALARAAELLGEVRRRHGPDAVGVYQGNPTVHSLGAMTYGQLFLRTLGSRNLFSATSADQLPHMLAAHLMLGHQLLLPIPDVDRAELMLVLGANPLVSGGSLMTAPGMRQRLAELRARGGRVIVVDPVRTRTAEVADEHLAIRPGTDALWLLGLLHVIFDEGLARPGRLGAHLEGLDAVRGVAARFAPERIAGPCGLDPDDVRRIARAFARARSVAYGRFGLSTQPFGGLCQWLLIVLHAVTGRLDEPGGFMFSRPAADLVGLAARAGFAGSFDRRRSRGAGLPSFSGELPVAALADEIEREGEGQIRALLVHAGNPVLSVPQGRHLEEALGKLEALVCIDFYLNETTRHADVILPPTSHLERGHYDLVFHHLAVRNTARYSPPLFARSDEARHDWEIFSALASRLGRHPGRRARGWVSGATGQLIRALAVGLSPDLLVDLLLRTGPWRKRGAHGPGLSLARLQQQPSGVDLGPLTPCLPERLFTADRKIHLAPRVYLDDVGRLERTWLRDEADTAGLVLIGRRSLRSNNSWMHNSARLMKGKDRCTVWMHPDDAAARGVVDQGRVEVSSRTGTIELPVEVTDAVRPGVVSVPHGFGHGRPGTRLHVAARAPGVSVNDITDETHVDELSGNAAFSGLPVEVRPSPRVPEGAAADAARQPS